MIFIIGMNYFYRFIKNFCAFLWFLSILWTNFHILEIENIKSDVDINVSKQKMVYLYSLITPGSNPDFLNFYLGSFVRIKSLLADFWPGHI